MSNKETLQQLKAAAWQSTNDWSAAAESLIGQITFDQESLILLFSQHMTLALESAAMAIATELTEDSADALAYRLAANKILREHYSLLGEMIRTKRENNQTEG